MEKKHRHALPNRLIAVVLTFAMIVSVLTGVMPGTGMTAEAADYTEGFVEISTLNVGDSIGTGVMGFEGECHNYVVTLLSNGYGIVDEYGSEPEPRKELQTRDRSFDATNFNDGKFQDYVPMYGESWNPTVSNCWYVIAVDHTAKTMALSGDSTAEIDEIIGTEINAEISTDATYNGDCTTTADILDVGAFAGDKVILTINGNLYVNRWLHINNGSYVIVNGNLILNKKSSVTCYDNLTKHSCIIYTGTLTNKNTTTSYTNTQLVKPNISGNITYHAASGTDPEYFSFGSDRTKYFFDGRTFSPVSNVALDNTSAVLSVDEALKLTASVTPSIAGDKTVKWSVGGTDANAVKLYSDEACTSEVGTDATETLTVYVQGVSAGTATVTAISNADSTKSDSCTVTVEKIGWKVGDSINLSGKYFYSDDNKSPYLGATTTKTVPTPTYSSGVGQWIFKSVIGNVGVWLSVPSDRTKSDIPLGFKIKSGDGTEGSPYEFELMYSSDYAVDSLTLDKETASITTVEALALTATVLPENATDKTVKWSVGGTNADAVELYFDEDCTTAVGADATETLTVYAIGVSGGTATVTATSNADSSKSDSCNVTVKADSGETQYVSVSTFDELKNAISNGNNIKLTDDIVMTREIEISNNAKIIIDGSGHELTGDGDRAFYIKSSDETLVLKNVTVSGFSATSTSEGGGAVLNQGTLVVDGCTFSDNHPKNYGGGAIENRYGKLYATGTTFSGNYSGEIGGAINNSAGLYLTNCTFTDNYTTRTSESYGGAIGQNNTSKDVRIINCTFSNNYANDTAKKSDFGAVQTPDNYTIAGCGDIVIEPSTSGLKTYKNGAAALDYSDLANIEFIYSYSNDEEFRTIIISGGANATTSGGSTSQSDLTGKIEKVTFTAKKDCKFPKKSEYYTTTNGITVTRISDTVVEVSGTPTGDATIIVPDAVHYTHTHTIGEGESAQTIVFTAWDEENRLPDTAGNYYLTKNVMLLSGSWTVPAGTTNLCLNGYTINTMNKNQAILVDNGNTLNIFGEKEENESDYSAGIIRNQGDMYTGYISENGAIYVKGHSTFSMYGCSIRQNTAKNGSVCIEDSTFNMYGGEISGNTTENFGAVYLKGSSTFNMHGGRVWMNSKNGYGGVYVSGSARLNLSGNPRIENNSAGTGTESHTSNVYLAEFTTPTVSVTGKLSYDYDDYMGSASIGISMEKPGVFTSGSTDELKASTYWYCFSSDDSSCYVITDGNELKIKSPHTHDFEYDASGATITATCQNQGCTLTDSKVVLTIVKPTRTTYGGTGSATATLDGLKAFNNATEQNVQTTGIKYYKATKSDDTYTKNGDALTAAPTDAGDYLAEIELAVASGGVGTIYTASVGYTIAPATISSVAVTNVDTPVAGEAIDTEATTTTTNVTLENSGAISWDPAVNEGKADYATVYKATVIAKADTNYVFADEIAATMNNETATVTRNQNGTLSISYTFAKTALNPVTITGADKEVDYSVDGISIPVEGMFTISNGAGEATYSVANGTGEGSFDTSTGTLTVTKCGTFTVSVNTAATDTYAAGTASATLTVKKIAPAAAAPTDVTATYGQTLSELTLTNPEGNTPGTWAWTDGTAYVGNVGTNTFTADFTPDDTDNYNLVNDVNVTVTVSKADPVATAPTAAAFYGKTLADVELTNPAGNTEGTWAWVDEGTTSVGRAGINTFTANFTPTDTANYNSVSNVDVEVTVTIDPVDKAAVDAVEAKIDALPMPDNVAITNAAAINEAKAAYTALTALQKTLINAESVAKLTDCETKLVKAYIADLVPANVKAADQTAIETARAAYTALSDAQKNQITSDELENLQNAENVLAFELYKPDLTTAADNTALEGDSEACKTLIADAKTAIDDLAYDFAKSLDDNKKAAEAILTGLISDLDAQRAADSVLDLIADIPTKAITKENAEEKVRAARAAYDKLSDAQKKLVDEETLKKLTDSETVLAVAVKIDVLPAEADVKDTDVTAIHEARDAFDALTAGQKAMLAGTLFTKLNDCEAALISDVVSDITGMAEITDENIAEVKDLLDSYDALTDEEKAAVNEKIGKEGAKKLADLEKAYDVAERVSELKDAKDITAADANDISLVRTAYGLLSQSQKAMVSEAALAKLEAAEAKLAELKEEAALEAEKADAIDRLGDYAQAKALADANDTEKAAYDTAVTEGQAAIAAAKDPTEVAAALTQAKAAIDAALKQINDDRAAAAAAEAEMKEADETLAAAEALAEIVKADADNAAADEYASEEDKKAIDVAAKTLEDAIKAANALADTATAAEKTAAADKIADAAAALAAVIDAAELNSAAAKAAAEALEAAKTSADTRLEDYAQAKALADADEKEQAAYNKAVTDGQAAIAAAKDPTEVAAALTQAKAAIDAALKQINDDRAAAAAAEAEMKEADETLAAAEALAAIVKADADNAAADEYASEADKKAINDAAKTLEDAIKAANALADTATAAEKTAAADKIADAAAALAAVTDTAEVNSAAAKAKAEEEAAVAAQLAAAKDTASDRLDDYSEAKALADATPEEKAAYDKVVADGQAAIAAAKDTDAVAKAVTDAKAAIDAALKQINDDRAAAAAAAAEMTEADETLAAAEALADIVKANAETAAADPYASEEDKKAINDAAKTLEDAIKAANALGDTATAAEKKKAAADIVTAATALDEATDAAEVNSAAAKVKAEEEAAAAAQLAAAKDTANDRLDDYSEAKALADATPEEKAVYGKAVADGKAAIAAAKDTDAVAKAVTDAKAAIDAALKLINDDRAAAAATEAEMAEADQAIQDALVDALKARLEAITAKTNEYIAEEDLKAVNDADEKLSDALDALEKLPENATADEKIIAAEAIRQAAAIVSMQALIADVHSAAAEKAADGLAAAKKTALERLDDYSDAKALEDFTEAEQEEYDEVVAAEKEKISAAADTDAVAEALKAAKEAVNAEIAKIKEDRAVAEAATALINGLSATEDITVDDKDSIKAARAAYEALTDDQKAKVSEETLKKLEDAEATLAVVSKYSKEWVDGKWYNKDATQTYLGIGKWHKSSKGWWFGDNLGWYAKNQWQKIDGKWYFFDKEGYMEAKAYRQGYYLTKDGAWDGKAKVTGWKQDAKGWYYSTGNGNYLKSCWKKIDGKWYYFKATGYAAQSEFVQGWWCNKNCIQSDPVQCSWHKSGSKWWYGANGGWYAAGRSYTIDGKKYTFDKKGYTK